MFYLFYFFGVLSPSTLPVLGIIRTRESEKVGLGFQKWRHYVILGWKVKKFTASHFRNFQETSSKLHWNLRKILRW